MYSKINIPDIHQRIFVSPVSLVGQVKKVWNWQSRDDYLKWNCEQKCWCSNLKWIKLPWSILQMLPHFCLISRNLGFLFQTAYKNRIRNIRKKHYNKCFIEGTKLLIFGNTAQTKSIKNTFFSTKVPRPTIVFCENLLNLCDTTHRKETKFFENLQKVDSQFWLRKSVMLQINSWDSFLKFDTHNFEVSLIRTCDSIHIDSRTTCPRMAISRSAYPNS